jgi:hypothetical protein
MMPDKGSDLGVDLSELWLCAHSYLPKVAEAFTNANGIVDKSAANWSAFDRYGATPTGMPGVVPGRVYQAWASARDGLQKVMGSTANNIYDTCDALDRVIQLYSTADTEAGVKFRSEREKLLNHAKTLRPGDPSYIWIEDPNNRPKPKMPE